MTQTKLFFPDYFAPESFLYTIIYKITNAPFDNAEFWRTMDMKEDTALYTADKIRYLFTHLPIEYNNYDLKSIFKENLIQRYGHLYRDQI